MIANPQALILAAWVLALCALLAWTEHRNARRRARDRAAHQAELKSINDAFEQILGNLDRVEKLPKRIPGVALAAHRPVAPFVTRSRIRNRGAA